MKDRINIGYRQAIISIFLNTCLFILKFWAGLVSGSIAIIADAWHTLSDSLSSLILIFGIRIGSRRPDKNHPYGYGRWEQITSIFIAFLLSLVAFEFLREAISRLVETQSAQYGVLAIAVTIFSITTKELLAQYAFRVAKKTNMLAVKADGWHHRSDALSSMVVLIGIFFSGHFWWIDGVVGIIVALMIGYAVFEILREAINNLLGIHPPASMTSSIRDILFATLKYDVQPHHFHLHQYGIHQEITFHIKLNGQTAIYEGHFLIKEIEQKIRKQLNLEATIHIDASSDVL